MRAVAVLVAALATTGASRSAMADGVLIDVSGAKRGKYPIAVPVGVDSDPGAAKELAEVLSFDLGIAGVFKVVDPASFLADLPAEKLSIEPTKWKDVGAYGVTKYRVTAAGNSIELEARLYEVSKGNTAVLTKTLRGNKSELRNLAHSWANEIVKYYTGEPGFFGSKIAFVSKRKKASSVMAMDFDGHGPYGISKNSSINTLPAWAPSGGLIAYTSYMRNNPDLYVVSAGGGRPKRLASYKGMNTGASWSPSGTEIAVTLSKDGNADIYVISAVDGSIVRRITSSKSIDTSPAWSPDGGSIAFVSDREGGPQIFVAPAAGGNARRVSFNGSYNTTPTWSPAKGAQVLAYTTRDGGRYDIVTLDLVSKKMVRITQDEGNNEEPSFSPNGRAIAFASTRSGGSGIYVRNADGSGPAVRVWSGTATGVDWGPAPN